MKNIADNAVVSDSRVTVNFSNGCVGKDVVVVKLAFDGRAFSDPVSFEVKNPGVYHMDLNKVRVFGLLVVRGDFSQVVDFKLAEKIGGDEDFPVSLAVLEGVESLETS